RGGTSKKTKEKSRIHHGIEIPCFLRQLINKVSTPISWIPFSTLEYCPTDMIFPSKVISACINPNDFRNLLSSAPIDLFFILPFLIIIKITKTLNKKSE
ncbi:hypothetical protein, partial [Lactobacillus helveticus]|uniref:hypothetical protein n=1 Tax=Lactobacillus helveticus TaxID=1587 RepID=UPI0021A6F167